MPKIAILTTAHIHTPNFVKRLLGRTDVQIAGVYDPNPTLAEKYAKELSVPILPNPDAVLADKSIDAVIITGATAQHDHLAAAAANAGKNLFIEKPLATTPAEAWRIFNAVKESGVIFQTGHFMRSDPVNLFIKNELDAGNLGTVTRARHVNTHSGALGGWFDKDYRWFFLKDQSGGGGFYDLGCHSLDILIYFFGPIESATAAIAPRHIKYQNIDEYGEGLLRFQSGPIGSLAGGWVDAHSPITHAIAGTEGHITVMHGQIYYASKKTKVPNADGKSPLDPALLPPALPHAFDLFLDVLVGSRKKEVLIPIEDALQVALAMDAMYTGDKISGWVKV